MLHHDWQSYKRGWAGRELCTCIQRMFIGQSGDNGVLEVDVKKSNGFTP